MHTILGSPCTFSDVCNNNTGECNLLSGRYVDLCTSIYNSITKLYFMKNIIMLCVLVSALVIGQSCAPKADKVAVEIAATRAKIAKASTEKDWQRKLAIAEKATPTPTYKNTSGEIVHYKADVDPSYTGGFDELRQSRKYNLTYPEAADHEGTVSLILL
jgi:hypothetical protein